MSSYVVDAKVINAIVAGIRYGAKYGRIYPQARLPVEGQEDYPWLFSALYIDDNESANSLGETLYEMNVNAVLQRYPSDNAEKYAGGYEYSHVNVDRLMVYSALKEYLYQCSEGYVDELPLFKAVQNWYNALAHKIALSEVDARREKLEALKRAREK